jgi:hypothetical protein
MAWRIESIVYRKGEEEILKGTRPKVKVMEEMPITVIMDRVVIRAYSATSNSYNSVGLFPFLACTNTYCSTYIIMGRVKQRKYRINV